MAWRAVDIGGERGAYATHRLGFDLEVELVAELRCGEVASGVALSWRMKYA